MTCSEGAIEPEGGDTQLSWGVNVVLEIVTDHEELMRGEIQLFEHATIEAERRLADAEFRGDEAGVEKLEVLRSTAD